MTAVGDGGDALAPATVNGVTVDFDAGLLRDGSGAVIPLRAQSFLVLRELARREGRTVSKDALMAAVWQGIAVTDDSLVQCVGDIRRALRNEAQTVLRTVPKRGYRLDWPPPPPGAAPPPSARRGLAWPPVLAGVAFAALALAMATSALREPGPRAAGAPAIAVLPFEDMSAAQDLGYMGEGVAEDVITMLARSPDVIVMARNSSFVYGDAPVDVRDVGVALGVDYVLEGSVRREGGLLRVTAQLVDARTGAHVWAERFDEAGADPPALQDDVTGRIIATLTGEDGELKRADYRKAWGKDTARLGEYDHYLRGLDLFVAADDKAKMERAEAVWREGLALYPDSTLLKVKLGFLHYVAAWNFLTDDIAGDFAEARRFAHEVSAAGSLTPEVRRLSLWLNAYVLMIDGAFDASVAEARRAVAMAPHDSRILATLSEVLAVSGRYEEALEWLEAAAARDPAETETYHGMRGFYFRLMGRYEDSLAEYGARAAPAFYDHLSIALNLVRLGQFDAARAKVRDALALDPTFTRATWREGTIYSDPSILESELADLAAAGLP